jgi:hypothetical protein
MKTQIMNTQKLNFKNAALTSILGFFVGFGLFHFIKAMLHLL